MLEDSLPSRFLSCLGQWARPSCSAWDAGPHKACPALFNTVFPLVDLNVPPGLCPSWQQLHTPPGPGIASVSFTT